MMLGRGGREPDYGDRKWALGQSVAAGGKWPRLGEGGHKGGRKRVDCVFRSEEADQTKRGSADGLGDTGRGGAMVS